jgi:methyl-accepting chemotaxis protein
MNNMSVSKRLGLLLGLSALSLALVIGALFQLTSRQGDGLGRMLDHGTEDHRLSFAIVASASKSQEMLFRLSRETDADSIEALLARSARQDSISDSLLIALNSKNVRQLVAELKTIGKLTIDKLLLGDLALAQQNLVEKYNPTFSHFLSALSIENEAQQQNFEKQRNEEGSAIQSLRRIITLFSLIALGLVLLLGLTILAAIRKSMSAMISTLDDLVSGDADLRKRLPVERGDEFGKMASLFNQFLEQQATLIGAVATSTNNLINATTPLTGSAREISNTAQGMSQKTQGVASAVEESSVSLQGISQNASEMARMVSTVAAAMEEMGASLHQTETSCIAEVKATEEGKVLATKARETILRLDTSAQEISAIVDAINDIAEQTNLLALNATIEAATAGEAGRGFAVVANEVKELAKQTSLATDSIANLAQAVRSATGDAAQSLELIHITIGKIGDSSQDIQRSVQEQTLTVKEVASSGSVASQAAQSIVRNVKESASGLQEISQNTSGLDQASQKTLRGIEKTGENISQLTQTAEELRRLVSRFKL